MKKRIAIFLALVTTISYTVLSSAQSTEENANGTEIILTINQPTMLVDGTEQRIDAEGTAPLIVAGRTLLPVRAVVEAMGGTVEWDGNTQMVTLTRNEDTIQLIIDSATAYLNGIIETLDVVPIVINDRTMLPIRFIAESFHFQVAWDAENQQVMITEEAIETAEPTAPPTTQHTEENDQAPITQPETPVVPDESQITVTVNGQSFTATLEDNETARAFYAMLPMTLDMDELNGNEKYDYLDENLPSSSRNIGQIRTGDLMLYGSNCIVSFFKTFSTSYTYTSIGHIDDAENYAAALPSGSVTITFSK